MINCDLKHTCKPQESTEIIPKSFAGKAFCEHSHTHISRCTSIIIPSHGIINIVDSTEANCYQPLLPAETLLDVAGMSSEFLGISSATTKKRAPPIPFHENVTHLTISRRVKGRWSSPAAWHGSGAFWGDWPVIDPFNMGSW